MQVPGSGLYLAAARGNGIQDYITTLEDGKTATIAQSHAYTYTFTPALISLPGKEADENGSINTAGDGEWLYDLIFIGYTLPSTVLASTFADQSA